MAHLLHIDSSPRGERCLTASRIAAEQAFLLKRVLEQPEATAPEPQNIVLFQQFEGRKHHEFSTR